MSISATCACSARIEAPDDLAGQSVKCPQCAAVVPLPAASSRQPPPLPSSSSQPPPLPVERSEPAVTAPGETKNGQAENYHEAGVVPADIKQKIVAELGLNEMLVWIGQPDVSIVFRRSLGYLIGGGLGVLLGVVLLMGSCVGFLSSSASNATAPQKQPVAKGGKGASGKQAAPRAPAPAPNHASGLGIFPVIILVIAVGCMVVPLYRWKMAQGSCYALTNRRAIVHKQGLFGLTRESYSPIEVAAMRRSDSWVASGGGDLIFKSVTVVTTSYNQRGGSSRSVRTTHYGFLSINNVQAVEKLVRETLIDRFVDKLTEAGAL